MLYMILEPNIEQYVGEEVEWVDTRRCDNKDVGSRKGGGLGDPTLNGEGNECQRGH